MGKSTSSKRNVTKSPNEVRDTGKGNVASAYRNQPVEDRKSKGKKSGGGSKMGY